MLCERELCIMFARTKYYKLKQIQMPNFPSESENLEMHFILISSVDEVKRLSL